MSSFHTAAHSAYWSCGPNQIVEDAGNVQPAATFDRGCKCPCGSELESSPGCEATTHVSQSRDLGWISANVFNLAPNADVGLGDLETNTKALSPAFGNSHSIPDTDNHTNAVRTERLFFNRGYRFKALHYRISSVIGSRRHPVGHVLPWLLHVFTTPKLRQSPTPRHQYQAMPPSWSLSLLNW
jgi:hypothetical protein